MKLMTYNILEGGTGRIDPLAEVIRLAGADVVVLQETWDTELFHKLADRLKMDRFLAENPRNENGATGLLSRWEIREAVNHSPLDGRLTRSAFHAVVRNEKQEARSKKEEELGVVGLHLHARETVADEEVRLGELPAVLEVARLFRGRPHVLAGDFNTSHPGQRIEVAKLRAKSRERISGQNHELPREVVRRVLEHGYVDGHALHHSAEDFDTSFTTLHPAMRVDFIFVSPDLAPRVRSCEVFKPEMGRFASDHFPVLLELTS
jgi:endonuclease/exonuclease/phosphatase family metal-dependent hydrolase